MWINLTPNDTTFFRSGRPFSLGDDTWADGVFPPYPSTLYGAIRTFLILERGDLKRFKEEGYPDIGNPDKKGSLSLLGPFLYEIESNSVFFPCPYDVVGNKSNKNDKLQLLSFIEKPEWLLSLDINEMILIYKGSDQVEYQGGWLDIATLKEYLQGQRNELTYLKDETFFLKELKIGIAREKTTLSSKEGHLYRLPMIRLKRGYSFLIQLEGIDAFPENGMVQFGAEGKTATLKIINEDPLIEIRNLDFKLTQGVFKIYLATPAIFINGWIPSWIDLETLEGEKDGVKLKLIGCTIGKYVRIGGWDMALGRPKLMYKAVPAGSVYYFKVLNTDDVETIKKIFHYKTISDINSQEGFGLSLVGNINTNNRELHEENNNNGRYISV